MKIKLEKENFKIDSSSWKIIEVDGKQYKVNPEGDIWEIIDGEYKGEQLFTWGSAMRETKKAGKRIPTDEEFDLFKKEDFPKVLPGGRNPDGSYYGRGSYGIWWSSTQYDSSISWDRYLYSSYSTVRRNGNSKAYGFSVVCLKN